MDYRSHSTKSALQRVRGMPFAWSLNPYRGCRHACLYCYARIYHSYLGFADPADFDRVILHKSDLPTTLRRELKSRSSPLGGEVAIGTATDPYQPLEAKERLTRRCIAALLEAGAAVSITTKSVPSDLSKTTPR
jgi:DNA repair photolyase